MTFDLTPEQQALSLHARDHAARIGAGVATVIDRLGAVPADVDTALSEAALTDVFNRGAVSAAVMLEELAAVSAGLAAKVGFVSAAGRGKESTVIPKASPGLRGSEVPLAAVERTGGPALDRARLAAAAIAVGVGRAAIAHAVAAMKAAGVRPGPDERAPHWVLADGATEVEAARLLTYEAAQSLDGNRAEVSGVVARAKAFATQAAVQAVDAAIRIEGPAGYVRGGLLERLTRDARTLAVILAP
jgi:alkylation response protein AidB-like acyl-CoA dehydrogenase